MSGPISVKAALARTAPISGLQVQGWVRTRRDSKDFSFIELNDGSCLRSLQVIAKSDLQNYADVQRLQTGASIVVRGDLVASQGKGQAWEVVANEIEIVGASDETYPLQKKGHTAEFLREIAHLRPRSNLFGAVFRVRSRLANEFWMIEPEMAFCDLQCDMDLAEEMVKYLIRDIRTNCAEDLGLFSKFVDKELMDRLDFVIERPFQRITYTDAVELLKKSGEKFEFPVAYGANLQSEHERWLTEKYFKCPVTVFNYPKEIKPFYMRLNDDGKTVTAMDVLVPGIGEIVGGSQREERLDVLEENMRRHQMDPADYKWYLDLRRYGTVPHAGFGLGFERMLMFVTGVSNIRDVIPFARTPGSAEF